MVGNRCDVGDIPESGIESPSFIYFIPLPCKAAVGLLASADIVDVAMRKLPLSCIAGWHLRS